MPLVAGGRLGPYEILAALGAGGMGEVYRARDTRLDRTVAIKVLPPHLASDPQFRKRFDREAHALAALNHPHICTLHDVGDHEGITFLVMEYLEGETLAAQLTKGALPLERVLRVAVEIADGLDKAHRARIVHRDLKPGNIMLSLSGAKLLDFGLAKTTARDIADADLCALPTARAQLTAPHILLGTFQYMAPEQLEGRDADSRSDIFAFGAVVYEMLTGRKAFDGPSHASLIAAILERDPPPLSSLQPLTPPALDRVVRRCLAKDPEARWQDARDLADELRWLTTQPDVAMTTSRRARTALSRRAQVAWVLAIAAMLLGTVSVIRMGRDTRVAYSATRLLVGVTPADQLGGTDGRPSRTVLALSPDGQTLVFSALRANRRALYLRRLNQMEATPVPGTDDAVSPFFSPDGHWAVVWAAGELLKVPIDGGPPIRICGTSPVFGASWGEDDRIVFATLTGGLWEVPAGGGTPSELTTPDRKVGEISHRLPHVLPGGDAILYTAIRHRFPRWDQAQIFAYSRRTRLSKLLIDGGADARYLSTGHLVYVREGVLLSVPFDLSRLEVIGSPIGVVPDVMQAAYARGQNEDSGAGQFAISKTGTLIYLPGGTLSAAERSVVRVERTGQRETLPISPRAFATLRLSPDGSRIALNTFGRDRDIWLYSLSRTISTKLTMPGRHSVPIWTPDGKRLTYASAIDGPDSLYWIGADGTDAPEPLLRTDDNLVPAAWTPDGQSLLYYPIPAETISDTPFIWAYDVGRKTPPTPIARTSAASAVRVGGVDVAPNGQWIAYHSAESGTLQVYIQAYPGPGPRVQVSVEGGISPIWRADGRELFYQQPMPSSADVQLMAVTVTTQPALTFGVPRRLFAGRYGMNIPARAYDVTGDGQRFYFLEERERPPDVITQMIVVQNWHEELKRLVPAK